MILLPSSEMQKHIIHQGPIFPLFYSNNKKKTPFLMMVVLIFTLHFLSKLGWFLWMIVCHKQCTLLWVGVIKKVSTILFGNSKQLYYNRFPYIVVFFNRLQSKKEFPICIFITTNTSEVKHFLYIVECETTEQKMAKQKTSKYILQSNLLLDLQHKSL